MYNGFKEYLSEALQISVARKYTKMSRGNYKTLYSDFFGNKDRIYFDFNIEYQKNSDDQDEIEEFLFDKGYEIVSYEKNIASKGFAQKATYKIGKLLKQFGREDLLKKYSLDPTKNIIKSKMKIVFSRHPYDIAGMSTNRDWRSCMTLPDGVQAQYLDQDIRYGVIVAYLVREGDENINKPLARQRIIPMGLQWGVMSYEYYESEDEGPIILRGEHACYTAPDLNDQIIDKFATEVNNILQANFNKDKPSGTYIRCSLTYSDGMPEKYQKK